MVVAAVVVSVNDAVVIYNSRLVFDEPLAHYRTSLQGEITSLYKSVAFILQLHVCVGSDARFA